MSEMRVQGHLVEAVVSSLLERWSTEVEILRGRGCEEAALHLGTCVAELETAATTVQDEALDLPEAARESGYSEAHLRRLIAEGRLAAVCDPGPIRVRRWSLPRKPGTRTGLRRVA